MRLPIGALLSVLHLISSTGASVIGVAPADQHLYVAHEGKWSCLHHPEIQLDWKQVNDDYCDCPDGSDEPGTSACENNKFWCENEGHIGSYAPSHVVNDGICDYVYCCDGSDEWNTGVQCEDRCAEIHAAYESNRKATEKIVKVGMDKATKIARAAMRVRTKLQQRLSAEESVQSFDNSELKRLSTIKQEKGDSGDEGVYDQLKSQLDGARDSIADELESFIAVRGQFTAVKEILDELLASFNQNLNDVAVKKTVEDYRNFLDEYAPSTKDLVTSQRLISTKFGKSVKAVSESSGKILALFEDAVGEHETNFKSLIKLEQILKHLIDSYNPNFNDPHVKEAVNSYQNYLSNKVNVTENNLVESIKSIKSTFSQVSAKLASLSPPAEKISADFRAAPGGFGLDALKSKLHFLIQDFLGTAPRRKATLAIPDDDDLNAVIVELEKHSKSAESAIKSIESQLSKNYGPNDILRAMENVSKTSKIGEYDYELSFIGEVRQRGGSGHDVKIGEFERAEEIDGGLVAYYENGAKCWNGPKRRAVVKIECGDEHELLAVSEPEKCEYHFRVKSPLGCPVEA